MKRDIIDVGIVTCFAILPVLVTLQMEIMKSTLLGIAAAVIGTCAAIHETHMPMKNAGTGYALQVLTTIILAIFYVRGTLTPINLRTLVLISIIFGLLTAFLTERLSILGTLPIILLLFTNMDTNFTYINAYDVSLTVVVIALYGIILTCWGGAKVFMKVHAG